MKDKLKLIKTAVTGGIAVGKSSLCREFSKQGFPVISADRIAKTALLPSSSVYVKILKLFQFSKAEPLSAQKISRVIFSNLNLKKKFEKIIHPFILQKILLEEQQLKKKGHKVIFYEIPLLFETKMEAYFDFIVLVDCPKPEQKKRLTALRGFSQSAAKKRIEVQSPQTLKALKSHFIVKNTFSLTHLKKEAQRILKLILPAIKIDPC